MPRHYSVWIGRVISLLVGLMFLMSALMKFSGGSQLREGMTHLGLSESLARPLGILELTCAVIYLVPMSSVLGAILLTGYLGGAILAHLRVGDPFVVHIVLGIFVWLGIAFRDDRIWSLIPVRRARARTTEEPASAVAT